jgi:hypothetical protein
LIFTSLHLSTWRLKYIIQVVSQYSDGWISQTIWRLQHLDRWTRSQ